MAGGIGSRFWPWSRSSRPKQFLDIVGDGRTMIQATYDRFETFVPAENTLIVTGEQFEKEMLMELPALHPSQVLTEPERRNTAPAIAYAAYKIASINPEAIMIVTPADHHIADNKEFRQTLLQATEYAIKHKTLMTIGIAPTFPATGYGYIELSEEAKTTGAGPIRRFKEKPDLEEAKQLLESGNYLWNSGMFVWRVSDIIDALEEHLPEVAVHFAEITTYGTPAESSAVAEAFLASPSISIDYGVMEKADNVAIVTGNFGWDDLGTWSSLQRYLETHPKETSTPCTGSTKLFTENSPRTLVHQGNKDKDTVIIGLEDYLVVDLEDVLLIAPKGDEAQLHKLLDDYATKLDKK